MLIAAFILGLVGTLTGCFSLFILSGVAKAITKGAQRAGIE